MFLTKFNHAAVAKSLHVPHLRRDNPLALTGLARSPSPRRQSHLHPNFFCTRLYWRIDLHSTRSHYIHKKPRPKWAWLGIKITHS